MKKKDDPKNPKKLVDNRGEKIYPFASSSRFFRSVTKFFLVIACITIGLDFLKLALLWATGKLAQGLDYLNNVDTSNDSLGLTEMFKIIPETFSGYPNWASNINLLFLKLHLPNVLIVSLVAMTACLFYYVITIALRHHNGEQSPFLDDRESRKLKKSIIVALDINFDGNEIVNDTDQKKSKKKITKTEELVNSTINSSDVQIHTRIDPKDNRTYKEYKVKIPQPNSGTVRSKVLSLIKDLDAVLTGITNGEVAFGKMENEVSRDNFIFRGIIEVERKVARSVIKNQKKSKTESGKQKKTEKSAEWAFPLELYEDRSGEIESQTELANNYAQEQKNSVDVFIIGSGIQATLQSMFVGNTSIQYVYKTAWDNKTASKVSNMEVDLENALKLTGIKVAIRGGLLEVTIPLPREENRNYTIPIDVKTMIERAYG